MDLPRIVWHRLTASLSIVNVPRCDLKVLHENCVGICRDMRLKAMYRLASFMTGLGSLSILNPCRGNHGRVHWGAGLNCVHLSL
jgi:hypothetical protein